MIGWQQKRTNFKHCSRIKFSLEVQKFRQLLCLALVWLAVITFPFPNCCSGNSHFLCELPECELFLISLDLDHVTNSVNARRQRFATFFACRNMGARYAHLPLCNTQQGYSPRLTGRGRKLCREQAEAFRPFGMGAVARFVAFQFWREQIDGRGNKKI